MIDLYDAFRQKYNAAKPQVLVRSLIADTETPVSTMLKLEKFAQCPFLLESVEGGSTLGRYSIIGINPDVIWRAHGNSCEINTVALQDANTFVPCLDPTLVALRSLIANSRIELPEGVPNVIPTLVGYLGYETIGLVEKLPEPKARAIDVPDMLLVRPTLILVFDRLKDRLTLVAPVFPDASKPARAAYEAAVERLDAAEATLAKAIPQSVTNVPENLPEPKPALSVAAFHDMVARAQHYIVAGDIFQVVLAQRFTLPFALPPFELYRALRRINPSPFLYYLAMPGFTVTGSSPEILVRVREGRITIRPIAGTRPRGATSAEDAAHEKNLLDDPKECAEHLMLLDLGRNDIGRVAVPNTVAVTDQFMVEHYSHVMHIVSNVEATLDPKHDVIDALFSGFPAGTVSGAPKIRAMEIIHELEQEKRGIYGGGVGYFGADGSMDSCIVLRTAIIKDGMMHVQAGAGIVADSVAQSEQKECEAKAGALIAAAREAYLVAAEIKQSQ